MIPWYPSKFFSCPVLNSLRCIFYLLLYLRLNCKTIKIVWFHFIVCVRMLGGTCEISNFDSLPVLCLLGSFRRVHIFVNL